MQELAPRRGQKRRKEQSEEQKNPLCVSKKVKKVKKGCVEHALNSTFSVDKQENGNQDINVVDAALIKKPQETISRTLRGRKKIYLTEESLANESENMKVSARNLKKSRRVDPKEQSSANSEGEKGMIGKKSPATDHFVLQPSAHELEPEQTPKRKLQKSASAVVENMCEESEVGKMPAKRTRSSDKAASVETSVEQSQSRDTPAKNETKSNDRVTTSFITSSESEPSSSTPPIIREKAALLQTSSYTVRNRKPTTNSCTPAKIVVPSAVGAKKAFTVNSETSLTPKLGKSRAAPNFAEIHQKNFLKMQSVDEYVEKKRKRTETMTASAKTVRTKSVLNNTATPHAKPPVAPKSKAATMQDSCTAPSTKDIKFNFISGIKNSHTKIPKWKIAVIYSVTSSFIGLRKPVFTAKGQVVNEKQRVVARVKENLQNNVSRIPAATARTTVSIDKRKASMLNVSREINTSKLSLAGRQILKGVRTNRRFGKNIF